MSSYPEYPQTPPGGTPASPPPPSWGAQPGASYGQDQGQGQAQARAQYGAPPAQEQYGAPAQQYGVQPYAQQQGYPAGMAQPQGQLVVAPRNPAISLIASFFVPGLGSMINSRVGIGILILGIYVFGLILSLFLIGIPIALGAWVWGMVDGYQSAQAWNRAHGIIS
jgi:TM2 domain-containing membrane protein YozV